jgi:hypothetical protein
MTKLVCFWVKKQNYQITQDFFAWKSLEKHSPLNKLNKGSSKFKDLYGKLKFKAFLKKFKAEP